MTIDISLQLGARNQPALPIPEGSKLSFREQRIDFSNRNIKGMRRSFDAVGYAFCVCVFNQKNAPAVMGEPMIDASFTPVNSAFESVTHALKEIRQGAGHTFINYFYQVPH